MKQIFLFCSLLYTLNLVAQDNTLKNIDVLVNTSHTKRTLLLKDFYNKGIRYLDSITVFSEIQKIEVLAKENNDNELFLETKLMRAHYYHYRDYFNKNFVVENIKTLDKIAKKEGFIWLEIRTQSLLANYLYYSHQEYGLGFEHFEKTVQLLENGTGEEFPLKQFCLFQLANIYYEFKEYKSALYFLKKAIKSKSNYEEYIHEITIYNSIGLSTNL